MTDTIVSLGEVHSPELREICAKRERMYAAIKAKAKNHVERLNTFTEILEKRGRNRGGGKKS